MGVDSNATGGSWGWEAEFQVVSYPKMALL